jgi:hypothetical protein
MRFLLLKKFMSGSVHDQSSPLVYEEEDRRQQMKEREWKTRNAKESESQKV